MTYLYAKIWKTLHRKNLLNGGGRAEDYGGVGQVWSLTHFVSFFELLVEEWSKTHTHRHSTFDLQMSGV